MTKKCTMNYGKTLDQGSVEHGFTDQNGRSVGYTWLIREAIYAELTEDAPRWCGCYTREDDAPMLVVEMRGSPTRDGKRYGPAFNSAQFPTLEAARQAAVKRVEQARKRDAKKFDRVPG
jgi:hypothetical protein